VTTPQQPVPFDPTQNVKDLFELTTAHQAELRTMDSDHVRDLLERDRQHSKEMRESESVRINAILSENAATVQRSAEVQAAQQQALAAQVAAAADAVRIQQATTATTVAETLRTTVAPILTRLDELSRAQYEAQGQKQQVVETRDTRADSRLSINTVIAAVAVLLSALIVYAAFHK
jgi:hypothetical protein